MSATVLPPVFGPVTSRQVAGGTILIVTGTGPFRGSPVRRVRAARVREPRGHLGHQQRMPRGLQLERAVGGEPRFDAVDQQREPRARLQRRPARSRPPASCWKSNARARNAVGQREENAVDFLALLLLERDDVVVDFDRAQRLEKQARAACRCAVHDAGNRAAMLRLDDQHVAAVAFGDDLILQVLRRLLAAQEGLERSAEPRPLFPLALADQFQLGTRVIRHVARRLDLLPHGRRFALERGDGAGHRFEQRKRARRATDAGARILDRIEKIRERQQPQRFERPPFDRERGQHIRQLARRPERKERVGSEIPDGLARGGQPVPTTCPRLDRPAPGRPGARRPSA